MSRDSVPNRSTTKAYVSERVFAAPKEIVFQAWTQVQHLRKWLGPKGFSLIEGTMELRDGGRFHFALRSPIGSLAWGKYVYREVRPTTRLVFVSSFSDEKGNLTRHPLRPAWPREVLTTLTFADCEGGSVQSMHVVPINADDSELAAFEKGLEEIYEGWRVTLDRLEEHLFKAVRDFRANSERELTLIRIIHASRMDVFKAFTVAERLAEWWGPQGFTNPRCDIDVRKFGSIWIDMRGPDGTVYPMSGTYLEIDEPQKLVFMSSAIGPDGDALFKVHNTIHFIEKNNHTILELHAVVSNVLPEAAPYLAGTEEGWSQSIDRLNELVSRQKKELQ
jgi:uncharacterized protein YndB with AHSA1/START domain